MSLRVQQKDFVIEALLYVFAIPACQNRPQYCPLWKVES